MRRFTTARVAEAAGVSVGSLYQYFPNKESILFRLQTDEWQRTGDLLEGILADSRLPPLDRLRSAVHAFFMSECEEAELRVALGDASPAYRDSPETAEHRKSGKRRGLEFVKEILLGVSLKERHLAADVVMTSVCRRQGRVGAAPKPIRGLRGCDGGGRHALRLPGAARAQA